ncbi:CHAT domain-containing protein [Streptomyces sp. URMC 125]|uniref:CHAT domain-containing protein n=1 Tax=Streptomyces sp. URMC 125 TaxID=3423419 RepID=UPI003F1D6338
MASPRDELVHSLTARVMLFAASYDRDAVLAPEALEEARALMACVPDPVRDPGAVRAVADLYRFRSLARPDGSGERDGAVADALERLLPAGAADGSGGGPGDRIDGGRIDASHRRAAVLLDAAVHSGDPGVWDRAVDAAREAVGATPPRLPPLRASALLVLGQALRLRFARTGALEDLHEAVEVLRAAGAAAGEAHPHRVSLLATLALVLRERHERTGSLPDLEEALRLSREVVARRPAGDVNRGGDLANLGIALRLRHERTGDPADLDEAVRAHREAIAVTPPAHPGYGMFHTGLGNALRARFEAGGDPADLDGRLAAHERALAAAGPGGAHRPALLVNLASALQTRHDLTGRPADAERAEALLREAARGTAPGGAYAAGVHHELALVLWSRLRRTGEPHVLAEALESSRTAARHPAAPPHRRLASAVAWGRLAADAGDVEQASQAYELAVGLLPALAPRQLAGEDAEHVLSRFPGPACDAAACAVAAGRPERAVELLELGRGVLLGRVVEGRDGLDPLRERDPELAGRLEELRSALGAGTAPASGPAGAEAAPLTAADRRHVLAAEWDRLLARARALPGLEHFLRPPPVRELTAQAAEGPVVVVNAGRLRCDALVLTPGGVEVVPLPALTLEDAVREAGALLTALARLSADEGGGLAELPAHEDAVSRCLAWLWDGVAGPVLDALGFREPPAPGARWPRVWWVPTGPLAFLPLHAAGHHRDRGAGRAVLDRVVSSYAPTVRALARARAGRPAARRPVRPLVVALPRTPGARPLPGAAQEAAALAGLLPGARLLTGPEATCGRVVAELPRHTWLHFAGHGEADPVSPSRSALLVHDHADHPLTVARLAGLELHHAELAYLSACTTARTGPALADEALHLAGGLQLAGFRHVVATLWWVDDTVAARIARRTYRELGAPDPDADRAARAVHTAVRAARERYPATPSLWAGHVHVGA